MKTQEIITNDFLDNLQFSKEWIKREIFKTNFKERNEHKKEFVKISKIQLLELVLKFIQLNESITSNTK